MARFTIGEPITTKEPFIPVDAGLKPGRHLFQLEVGTADGRISKPDQAIVTVLEPTIAGPDIRNVIDHPVIGRVRHEHDQPPA